MNTIESEDSFFAGIDIGSTMTKVVITNSHSLTYIIGPTGAEHRRMANKVMQEALDKAGISFSSLAYVVATGYGRINVPFADKQITEISCHARGVFSLIPETKTIIDIGGQDCKAMRIEQGKVIDFVMNDKCAAGTGRFLEVIAETLGIKLEDMGKISLQAKEKVTLSSICTIFAEQEVISSLAGGVPLGNIIAGLHEAIARRIGSMAARVKPKPAVVVTGGGAKNIGLVKALEERLGVPLLIPPEPLITGALGAAVLGKEAVLKAQREGKPLLRKETRLETVSL